MTQKSSPISKLKKVLFKQYFIEEDIFLIFIYIFGSRYEIIYVQTFNWFIVLAGKENYFSEK